MTPDRACCQCLGFHVHQVCVCALGGRCAAALRTVVGALCRVMQRRLAGHPGLCHCSRARVRVHLAVGAGVVPGGQCQRGQCRAATGPRGGVAAPRARQRGRACRGGTGQHPPAAAARAQWPRRVAVGRGVCADRKLTRSSGSCRAVASAAAWSGCPASVWRVKGQASGDSVLAAPTRCRLPEPPLHGMIRSSGRGVR